MLRIKVELFLSLDPLASEDSCGCEIPWISVRHRSKEIRPIGRPYLRHRNTSDDVYGRVCKSVKLFDQKPFICPDPARMVASKSTCQGNGARAGQHVPGIPG